jgi:asparagine synthase (glutamine-hydrolysing)
LVRESVIRRAVDLIPTDPSKRSKIHSAKRLLEVVSRPGVRRYMHWMSAFNERLKEPLYSDLFRQQTAEADATAVLGTWFKRANGIALVDALLLTDQMTYLPNDLLVKVDIATMAVSLEARSPFLDHHVIEFAASLPPKLKLRGLTSKYLLKKVLRKLLPTENLNRRKMGFGVPIGHWFRGKMQPFLREVILSDKALRRGLFKPEAVRQLVELHVRRERDYSHQLWTLLMLELWFNRFIDSH